MFCWSNLLKTFNMPIWSGRYLLQPWYEQPLQAVLSFQSFSSLETTRTNAVIVYPHALITRIARFVIIWTFFISVAPKATHLKRKFKKIISRLGGIFALVSLCVCVVHYDTIFIQYKILSNLPKRRGARCYPFWAEKEEPRLFSIFKKLLFFGGAHKG